MTNRETNLRNEYIRRQRNAGFKAGDTVKVLCKAKSRSKGWGDAWVRDMNACVGKYGKVRYETASNALGIPLSFKEGRSWNFPYFVLRKTPKPNTL